MTVPPIPALSNAIRDVPRDKPPVMVLDKGLGSRLQIIPAHDPEPARIIGIIAGDPPETDKPPHA